MAMDYVTVELGSLEELEPALSGEEFEVARVFVGYGASAPSAPEPCPLPKVAYSLDRPAVASGSFRTGEWHQTWTPAAYSAAIETVREAIREGDVYQVNLVQHLWADFAGDPLALAPALAPLRPLEPAPLQGAGWTIVSASPELLLQKRGNGIRTSPIKGTRLAGVRIESEKDTAEHVMIVDLERNDLSRVCVPGTVRWPELLAERQLAGVTHLVATVEGELRPDVTLTELLGRGPPWRLGHRLPEEQRARAHRGARAGRARSVDGSARPDLRERTPRSRAHHPHLRSRRGHDPPLGGRRHRVGLPGRG
jgi:hypothetical protein